MSDRRGHPDFTFNSSLGLPDQWFSMWICVFKVHSLRVNEISCHQKAYDNKIDGRQSICFSVSNGSYSYFKVKIFLHKICIQVNTSHIVPKI